MRLGYYGYIIQGYSTLDNIEYKVNVRPDTNIAYGVIYAMCLPGIYKDIINSKNMLYDKNGIEYELVYIEKIPTIFIKISPFTVLTEQCSDVCPNAGNLHRISKGKLLTYSFDLNDYFEYQY